MATASAAAASPPSKPKDQKRGERKLEEGKKEKRKENKKIHRNIEKLGRPWRIGEECGLRSVHDEPLWIVIVIIPPSSFPYTPTTALVSPSPRDSPSEIEQPSILPPFLPIKI